MRVICTVFQISTALESETVSNLGVNSSPGRAMGRRQDGRGGLLVLFYPHVWDGLIRVGVVVFEEMLAA